MAKSKLSISETGRVVGVSGPVVKIEGLPYVEADEIIQIGKKRAIVFRFNREFTEALVNQDTVYALAIEDTKGIRVGDRAERTKSVFEISVGKEFLGRAVDPLGRDINTGIEVKTKEFKRVENAPPEIMERGEIRKPLETGIKVIDALFPIGRGQRELIVGDRKTGKTAIAIDAILNQKDVICVYVAIGKNRSEILQILRTIEEYGALNYTVVVESSSSDSPVFQYLAPFSAMTIAEYFRDQGKDVLVIFDDLTKHAWAWRELSLLLGRPPGREAYPGDIFYLHARLLERAAKLNDNYGGGSITALPICETKEGDISEYIPTDLISITDGQLYLEAGLFQKGMKPAVNIGLSVSRIGSRAQRKCIKEATQGLKLILSQHQELKKLIQLETKISEKARKNFKRGEILLEVFKQKKHELVDSADQSIIYLSVIRGLLDDIDLNDVKKFENSFYRFINNIHPEFKESILKNGWTDEAKAELDKIFNEFKLME